MNLDRIPSLNWLRVFVAAARAESFSRAGHVLHMSAPAVSQQIKALEAHVGVELFTRRPRSVALSEHGRAWLPAVEHALLSLETATDGLFGPRQQAPLHLQSLLLFALGILAPRLADFEAKHPDVRLHLSTANDPADSARIFPGLQIVFGSPAVYAGRADALFGEKLYPVARPDIANNVRCIEDVLAHPLFEVATHKAGWLQYLEAQSGALRNARFTYTDSTVYSFSLAAGGAGIALARSPASDTLQHQMGLVPCLDEVVQGSQHYYLVQPDSESARPAAAQFRAWLMGQVAPLA